MDQKGQGGPAFGSADWLTKASPDELMKQGKAIIGRIGQLDQTYRDRFVSEVRSDPQAARFLEQLTETTT